ncbi:Os11g0119025 [Oryza sativa Japonica Group]|uniref:Os11g0119025 protein n=2 Tax=Oryza TaxID=4527 RepID=A0A0P0XYB5_ORYSJ|nr:Os11g0119025 [Oryza sativa Japonica Group]
MEVRAKPQYCRGRDSMGSLLSELATVEADGDGGGGGGGLGANQQCGSSRSKRQTNHSKETAVDWWVSWGFAVVVTRTFLNWYRCADYTAYAFNTWPVACQPCQTPQVYYMQQSRLDRRRNTTVTVYERRRVVPAKCGWRIRDPAALLDRVIVLKKPDPDL